MQVKDLYFVQLLCLGRGCWRRREPCRGRKWTGEPSARFQGMEGMPTLRTRRGLRYGKGSRTSMKRESWEVLSRCGAVMCCTCWLHCLGKHKARARVPDETNCILLDVPQPRHECWALSHVLRWSSLLIAVQTCLLTLLLCSAVYWCSTQHAFLLVPGAPFHSRLRCRIPVCPGTTHQVVRQYLLHYGYEDTLRAFDVAAGLAGEDPQRTMEAAGDR